MAMKFDKKQWWKTLEQQGEEQRSGTTSEVFSASNQTSRQTTPASTASSCMTKASIGKRLSTQFDKKAWWDSMEALSMA
jgi:hypothetical protein